MARLCYTHHGGSGFTFTRADVLDMDLPEATYHLEWIARTREAEAAAIRGARGR